MNKMNKKGFTLIELLAVIILLAIVALIAVPRILDVIESAKKSAATSEANMVIKAIQQGCFIRDNEFDGEGLNKCVDGDTLLPALIKEFVDQSSSTVISGIKTTNNVITEGTVTSNGYEVTIVDGAVTTTDKV